MCHHLGWCHICLWSRILELSSVRFGTLQIQSLVATYWRNYVNCLPITNAFSSSKYLEITCIKYYRPCYAIKNHVMIFTHQKFWLKKDCNCNTRRASCCVNSMHWYYVNTSCWCSSQQLHFTTLHFCCIYVKLLYNVTNVKNENKNANFEHLDCVAWWIYAF